MRGLWHRWVTDAAQTAARWVRSSPVRSILGHTRATCVSGHDKNGQVHGGVMRRRGQVRSAHEAGRPTAAADERHHPAPRETVAVSGSEGSGPVHSRAHRGRTVTDGVGRKIQTFIPTTWSGRCRGSGRALGQTSYEGSKNREKVAPRPALWPAPFVALFQRGRGGQQGCEGVPPPPRP